MSRQIYRFRGLLALVTTFVFVATGAVVLWQASRSAEAAVAADVARSTTASQPFNNTNSIVLVPSTAGSGTITINGAAGNDTVTVGATTYTFVNALSASPFVPNQVLIGGTNNLTADNLRRAINDAGAAGTNYALGTAPNRDASAFVIANQVFVVARIVGRQGNIGLSKVGAAIVVSGAALTGGAGGTAFVANRQANILRALDLSAPGGANRVFSTLGADVGVGSVDSVAVGNNSTTGDDNNKLVVAVDTTADVVRVTAHNAGAFGAVTSTAPGLFAGVDPRANAVLYNSQNGGGDFQAPFPLQADEIAIADAGANRVRFLNPTGMAEKGNVVLPNGSGPIWIDARTFDALGPVNVSLLGGTGGPARKILAVANQAGNTISFFAAATPDITAMTLVGTTDLAADGIPGLSVWNNIVIAPDGKSAYVAVAGANRLLRIAISTDLGVPTGTILAGGLPSAANTGLGPQMITLNQLTGQVAVSVMGTATPPGAGAVQIFNSTLSANVTTGTVSLTSDNNPVFGGPGSDFIFVGDGANGIEGFNATDGTFISNQAPNGGGPGTAAFWPPISPIAAGGAPGRMDGSATNFLAIDKQTGTPNVFGATVEQANGINLGPRNNGVTVGGTLNEGNQITLTPSWVDDDRNDITSVTGSLIGIDGVTTNIPLPQPGDPATNAQFIGGFGGILNTQDIQRNIATRAYSFTPGADLVTAGNVLFRFSFTATDSQGATSTQIREVLIGDAGNAGSPNAPTIDAVGNTSVNEGGTVTVTATTRDTDVTDRPVFKGAIGNPGPPFLSTFQINDGDGGNVAGNAALRTQFGLGAGDATPHVLPNSALLSLNGGSNATGVNSAVLSFSPAAGTAGAKIKINLQSSDGVNRSAVVSFFITINQSNVAPTLTFAIAAGGNASQVRETPANPTTNADATFHAFEDIAGGVGAGGRSFRFTVAFDDLNRTPTQQQVSASLGVAALAPTNGTANFTVNGQTITVTNVGLGGATFDGVANDQGLFATFEVTGLDDNDGTNLFASIIGFTATDTNATPASTSNSVSVNIVDSNTVPTFANATVGAGAGPLAVAQTLNENTTTLLTQLVRDTDASHAMAVDLLNAAGTAPYSTQNNVSVEIGNVSPTGVFTSAGAGVTTVSLSALSSSAGVDADFQAGSFTGRLGVRITVTFNSAIDNTPSASAFFTIKARNTFNSQTKSALAGGIPTPGTGAPTGTAATTNSAFFNGGAGSQAVTALAVNGRNVNRNPGINFVSADQGNNALIIGGTNNGGVIPIGAPTETQTVGSPNPNGANAAGNIINRANMTIARDQVVRVGAQSTEADTNVGTVGAAGPPPTPGTQGATEIVAQGSSVTITRVTDASGLTATPAPNDFTANVTILQPAAATTTTAPTLAGAAEGPGVLRFPQSITGGSGALNLNTLVTGTTTANFFRVEFNAQDNTNFAANGNTNSDVVTGKRVRSLVVKVLGPTNNAPNVNVLAPDLVANGTLNENLKDPTHAGNSVRFISRFLDTNGAAPNNVPVNVGEPVAVPSSTVAPLSDAGTAVAGAGNDGSFSILGTAPNQIPQYYINQGTRLSFDLDDFANDFETNNAVALGGSPAPLTFTVNSTIPGLSTTGGNLSGITPTAGQDPGFAGTTADEFTITPPFNTVVAGSTSAFFNVTVTVSDGTATTTKQFIVEVFKRNPLFSSSAPVFTLINNAAPPGGGVFTSASVRQGATINIPTEVNDNNLPAGDVLTFSIQSGNLTGMTYATEGANGAASPNGSTRRTGTFQWVVPANQTVATYVVLIRVADSATPANVANFTIQIPVAGNTAPVATPQTINGQQKNTVATVTVAGTDAEGDALTFALSGAATGGTATIAGNVVTFTPTNGFTGAASFQFTASDGLLTSGAATVTINYVNTAPTATGTTPAGTQSVARNSTTGVTFALNGAGNDPAESLTFSVVTAPSNGTLTGLPSTVAGTGATSTASANVTYKPTAGTIATTDSFSFKVNDGTADSATFTVNITIGNNAPVATPQGPLAMQKNVGQTVTLAGTDADGDTLTFAIVAGSATNGTVTLTGNQATFTPTAGFTGTASFQFTANDGISTSAAATVSFTVTNTAPTVANASASVLHDRTATVVLTGADVNSDTLTFSQVGVAVNGTLTLGAQLSSTSRQATFTPAAGFVGTASFQFKANDGTADSNTATFTITVTNTAPVANAGTATTLHGDAVTVVLIGTDADGDSLTFSQVGAATNGTLALGAQLTPTSRLATFTPTAGFAGTGTFQFKANDGAADSNTATFTITVTNTAPVATPQAGVAVQKNIARTVTLAGTDADGDPLTFALSGAASNGTVTLAGNVATFTPTAGFTGTASFQFTVNDGITTSAAATVSLTVSNDAPVVAGGSASVLHDRSVTVVLSGTDVNGDSLTFSVVGTPVNGTVTLGAATSTTRQATFTPTAGFTGTASFQFKANDGTADSNTATFTIPVTNTAPVANSASASVSRNTAASISLTGTDADGDSLRFAIVGSPTKGTVTVNATTGVATYTPNAGASGADSFTFTVNDGAATSSAATVSLVIAGNTAATINAVAAQTVSKNVAKQIVLSAQGNDPGETLTFAIGTAPTKGTITGFTTVTGTGSTSAGSVTITYTPTLNASGADSFTFTVTDGPSGGTVTSSAVTITIVNSGPSASAGAAISVNELSSTAISGATATDPDPGDVLTIAWTVQGGATNGSLTNATTLTPTYTAPDLTSETSRAVTLTLTVTDTSGATATSNRTVTVNRTLSVTTATFSSKTLTITGTGFAAGATVFVDGVNRGAATVVSATTVTIGGRRKDLGIKPKGSAHTITIVQGTNNSNAVTVTL